jgi:hypothetical protein
MLRRAIRRVGPLGALVIASQVAGAAREHWRSLPGDERARLESLLRRSRGRPSNLSKTERRELVRLVRALELPRLARDSAVAAAGMHRRVRRS